MVGEDGDMDIFVHPAGHRPNMGSPTIGRTHTKSKVIKYVVTYPDGRKKYVSNIVAALIASWR